MATALRIEHSHCWCIVLSTKFLKLKVGNPVAPTHVLSQDPRRPSASEPEKVSSPVIKDTGSLVFRWLTAKKKKDKCLRWWVYQLARLIIILHVFKYQIVFYKYA